MIAILTAKLKESTKTIQEAKTTYSKVKGESMREKQLEQKVIELEAIVKQEREVAQKSLERQAMAL